MNTIERFFRASHNITWNQKRYVWHADGQEVLSELKPAICAFFKCLRPDPFIELSNSGPANFELPPNVALDLGLLPLKYLDIEMREQTQRCVSHAAGGDQPAI
jgi:hypothetical protein